MVEAIRDGEADPAVLAKLADPRLRAKPEVRRAALNGRVTARHRILLGLYLDHIDATQRAIARAFEAIWQHVEAALMSRPGSAPMLRPRSWPRLATT